MVPKRARGALVVIFIGMILPIRFGACDSSASNMVMRSPGVLPESWSSIGDWSSWLSSASKVVVVEGESELVKFFPPTVIPIEVSSPLRRRSAKFARFFLASRVEIPSTKTSNVLPI